MFDKELKNLNENNLFLETAISFLLSHFTGKYHFTLNTKSTSQENVTSLEMLFKLTVHSTEKCDFMETA